MTQSQQFSYEILTDTARLKEVTALFETVFEDAAKSDPLIDDRMCVIGAMSEGVVVGGAVAYELPLLRGEKEMYLYDIAVVPEYQRKGIGAGLISRLKEEATRRGVTTVFVEAEADDEGAVAFYRSLNGEEIAVRHFNINIESEENL